MAKKYFWLKLKEDFFDKRVIKKLLVEIHIQLFI